MIEIKVIASGSSGNCYRIVDSTTTLMIEAGIRFQKIREAFSFKLSEVAGCLVTHEHLDHAKATKGVMKAGIDCYMTQETADRLNVSGHRLKPIIPGQLFTVGTFKILPFSTQHDAVNPVGFLIQSESGEKVLFATDTYYIKYRFTGLNYVLLECNYSKEILEENIKAGIVPAEIRNRIVKSHFEIKNVKKFFKVNNCSSIRQIYLIHLSGDNADPGRFKKEVQEITGKPVFIVGV